LTETGYISIHLGDECNSGISKPNGEAGTVYAVKLEDDEPATPKRGFDQYGLYLALIPLRAMAPKTS
jgi:hypothetical protein